MRTTYIVTYDICDDARLRKVFNICRNYGVHLQLSVFECDLSSSDLVNMRAELHEVIHGGEDQVLFIQLGPSASRGKQRIESMGVPYVRLDAPCYIV